MIYLIDLNAQKPLLKQRFYQIQELAIKAKGFRWMYSGKVILSEYRAEDNSKMQFDFNKKRIMYAKSGTLLKYRELYLKLKELPDVSFE